MSEKPTRAQLEANRWLYRNQDFAQKLAQNVTGELTRSGEFFSEKVLTAALKDAVDNLTTENSGLSAEQINELTSDPKKAAAVVSTLSGLIRDSSPSAKDKNGNDVYTTQEIVKAEQDILIHAKAMAERSTEGQPFGDTESIQTAIAEVDGIIQEGSDGKYVMRQEYKELFNSFLQPSYLQIANGPPGCGKSTLAQGLIYAIVKDATEHGKPVPNFYATAPSAKAAGGIVDDMKGVSENCGKILEKMDKGEELVRDPVMSAEDLRAFSASLPEIKGGKPLDQMLENIEQMKPGDILVLDEAGLAGAVSMARLLKAADKQGIRLFMLGDNLQIPPSMAGNGLDELLMMQKELGIKTTELEIVLRQRDKAEAKWTLDLRAGDPKDEGNPEKDRVMKALNGYSHRYYTGFDKNGKAEYKDVKDGEEIPAGSTPGLQFIDDPHGRLISDYIEFRQKYPSRSSVVMAATDTEAQELLGKLRGGMVKAGIVHDVQSFKWTKEDGKEAGIEVGIGDTMMLGNPSELKIMKKNSQGQFEAAKADDITSGDQLEIVGYDKETKQFTFKKGKNEFTCDAKAFAAQAKHGLVLPLYEAQGASRDRAFMAVSEAGHMDKVHTGVAFSRHEQQMSAYVSKQAYPDGVVGFAKEVREFSTRKQLYSDGKKMAEVLKDPGKPTLQSLLQTLEIGDKKEKIPTEVIKQKILKTK